MFLHIIESLEDVGQASAAWLRLDECRDVVETGTCKGRVSFLARETLSPKRDDRGSSFTCWSDATLQ